jgi:NarL family two-component system response regulator LiaR
MAEGLSNKEIALKLTITERTVEFHVGNILRKLEVASRVEAVVWAKERGIIP